jgi:hypothetical protein
MTSSYSTDGGAIVLLARSLEEAAIFAPAFAGCGAAPNAVAATHRQPRQMPRFCIVVKSSDDRLYRALEEAFLGRIGFTVIRERRGNRHDTWPGERRKARVWETGELAFAECEE